MSLYSISNEMRKIYEELYNGNGFDEETGEIKEEVLNALTIKKEELELKSIDYGYVIKSFQDEIELYDKEIKRLNERKKQLKKLEEKMKELVKNAMIEFNILQIKGKTLNLSIRKSEAVEIIDESLLEERFVKTKIEPNKTAIKEALKEGEFVYGANLVEKKSLQIR